MKARVIGIVAFAGLLVCGVAATAQQVAYARNDVKSESELTDNSLPNDEIINFIISTAGARMVGAEEGRLAAERGTTGSIRAYGELMIKDQKRLLGELKRLAVLRGVTIPENTYSNELDDKSGQHFNNTFVKTMIMEHERDIKIFKKAMTYGDPEVSAFAARYLPLIESHLEKVKSIKKR